MADIDDESDGDEDSNGNGHDREDDSTTSSTLGNRTTDWAEIDADLSLIHIPSPRDLSTSRMPSSA